MNDHMAKAEYFSLTTTVGATWKTHYLKREFFSEKIKTEKKCYFYMASIVTQAAVQYDKYLFSMQVVKCVSFAKILQSKGSWYVGSRKQYSI